MQLNKGLAFFESIYLGFYFYDTDFIKFVHDVDEFYDVICPPEHSKREGRLCGNAFVSIDHFRLHPSVALVHLPNKLHVLLSHLPHVELFQTFQKVFLFDLKLDFCPYFMKSLIVTPVNIRLQRQWKRVLQNQNRKNRLNYQMVWFHEVAELRVLFECCTGRPRRVSDESGEHLVDAYLILAQVFVSFLIFSAESLRNCHQMSVYISLKI